MNWIFLGVQGSGKGTQAKLLAEKNHLVIFEAGAELRKLAKQNNPLSQEVTEIMQQGDLVRPEIINYIFKQFLENTPQDQGIILDGFPRSMEQMGVFEAMLKKYHRQFNIIHILLKKDQATKRLLKRAEIENRKDDNPNTIAERLDIFYNVTIPVIKKLSEYGELIEINGNQSIKDVFKELISKIKKYNK